MSRRWLDLKTRSILQGSLPNRETAVGTETFTLLIVELGNDSTRAELAIQQIQQRGTVNDTHLPNVVARQLTLDDALLGQFDLACSSCRFV